MVTCKEAFFLIQRHYDGELSMEEQTMLDHHLLGCVACQQEFDEYGEMFADFDALVVQIEHRDILSQTLERTAEAKRKRRADIWWRGTAVAASFLVIASTAFLSLTDAGQGVKHHLAQWVSLDPQQQVQAPDPLAHREITVPDPATHVENDSTAAQVAYANIKQKVRFTLLELRDSRLELQSAMLTGDKEGSPYQMVELEYRVLHGSNEQPDTLYVIAANDESMRSAAKSNLGYYKFDGELQAGPFKWARVGSHALTAEINGVYYQLFSPFLNTEELAQIAATIKKAK